MIGLVLRLPVSSATWYPERMKNLILLGATTIMVLSAISSVSEGAENLLLTVDDGRNRAISIASADVVVVYADGSVSTIGTSDEAGVAEIDKEILQIGLYLIVCSEGYFCGAIDIEKGDLVSYDVFSILLARFSLT